MNTAATWRIATEEWRYWRRSKTGVAATVIIGLLVLSSLASTWVQVEHERTARLQLQATAEETFRSQPARHPHRMVHYGHYVFRTPAPLAIADPGVDPYTGTVMFLEGHKQNSATFAPQYTQAHAGPYAFLSPALTYQLLVPLLLIVVGFASLSREREARTDQLVFTMAVSPTTFWMGKSLALAMLALLALLPLALVATLAWLNGEHGFISLTFWMGYALYMLCWVFLITAASAWSKRAASSLLSLLTCWIALCILLPRIATGAADVWAPLHGKILSDLAITRELRDAGDAHNANDPAFTKLRAQLLAQYDVDSVDALPVNFRGVVAKAGEQKLTDVLNRFASQRMQQEIAQANVANAFSVITPFLALKSFSITTAGTGIRQHHQFIRDAEAMRFAFVQGLNDVHINELSYANDINRNIDEASSKRSRVEAHHWRMLDDFPQTKASVTDRVTAGTPYVVVLLLWLFGSALIGRMGALRAAWTSHG